MERVCAEHATDESDKAWMATDPLWHAARAALIGRLLDEPKARDTVLLIDIKVALNQRNDDSPAELLPNSFRQRLGAG